MKKRIIGISLAVICLAMMFLLTACGSKTALSKEKFEQLATDNGMIINDTTSQFNGADVLKSSTTVAVLDGNTVKWSCDLLIFTDNDSAVQAFEHNKSRFENDTGGASINTSVNIGNYNTYKAQAKGEFRYLCRVDNTLLYVSAEEQYKDEISAFIDKLGY